MAARVVVGVDRSDASRVAVDVAVDQARLRDATLEVVHAWMPTVPMELPDWALVERHREDDEADHAAFMTTLVTNLPQDLPIEWRLEEGPAAATLLERAEGADLLVVGTRGHGGFSGLLLGSTSHQVVTHAHCPVLVVPPGVQG